MEACSCPLAGWCERHKLNKSDHLHKLCQTRDDYRLAWDENRGPMQDGKIGVRVRAKLANHWNALHEYAVKHTWDWDVKSVKKFYKNWERTIPNTNGCGCKEKWKALDLTPDFESPSAFFKWAWRSHNTVNLKLNKPIVTLCEACATWGFELS
jgi:hypothetical protein